MAKNLIIIKIGGSVISDKDSNKPIFKKIIVRRLFEEIKSFSLSGKYEFILVHGGGSFGHPLAKKYRLNEGYLNPESSIGVALTKLSVLKLSQFILEELNRQGLNACLLETSAIATTHNDKIKTFNLAAVKNVLNQDIIPVLAGDVVTDSNKGISILSGDQTVVYLAKKLKTKKVIFVSDVDGIFNKNPKTNKDAKLITKVNFKNYQQIIDSMEVNNKNDVTGEMKGKIIAIKGNLISIPVIIINGTKRGNLKSALSGNHSGTRILFGS